MNSRALNAWFAYALLAATLVSVSPSEAEAQRGARVVIEPAALTTPDGKQIHYEPADRRARTAVGCGAVEQWI
jgi:hypothetical protein